MATRWTDEMAIKFVKLYKFHECLWQTHHPKYKNKEARAQAIQHVVEEMGISDFGPVDCKNKIKNLRSHYCQELKKIQESKNSAGDGGLVYEPSISWFHIMDGFLKNFVQQSSNIPRSYARKSYLQDPEETEGEFPYTNLLDESSDPLNISQIDFENEIDEKSRMKRTNEMAGFDEPEIVLKARKLQSHPNCCVSTLEKLKARIEEANKETEFDIFGKSVGAQLNKLPLEKALKLQLHIQNLLTEERLINLKSTDF